MHYKIIDLGVKVEAKNFDAIPKALGYQNWNGIINANGGVMPDIESISVIEYDDESDGYDVI